MDQRESAPHALAQDLLRRRGYGMFIHFGVNTFNEIEWSDGTLPVASYRPTQLNPDGWIRLAKEAGFRHVVLVTKHHDGFCLWPTTSTDYSVGTSPVPRDVVGEVAAACRRHGVELGLYYSLWDRHEPSHDTDTDAYVEYVLGHLRELLTGYGPVCELWFDGGWAKQPHEWRLAEVYDLVHQLQPACAVTVNHTTTKREDPTAIVNAEDAVAGDPLKYWPVDFRTKDPSLVRLPDPVDYLTPDGATVSLPFEHTVCLSERANWFQKAQPVSPRSIDELEELFYWCTAQGNALLVNVPPGVDGRVSTADSEAVLQLADRLGIRDGSAALPAGLVDQAREASVRATSATDDAHGAGAVVDGAPEATWWEAAETPAELVLERPDGFRFDRVVIAEKCDETSLGDEFSIVRTPRVTGFAIDALRDGSWTRVHEGSVIGPVRVVRLPAPVEAEAVALRVTGSDGAPRIQRISLKLDENRQPRSAAVG